MPIIANANTNTGILPVRSEINPYSIIVGRMASSLKHAKSPVYPPVIQKKNQNSVCKDYPNCLCQKKKKKKKKKLTRESKPYLANLEECAENL